jgi:hypothetical protein
LYKSLPSMIANDEMLSSICCDEPKALHEYFEDLPRGDISADTQRFLDRSAAGVEQFKKLLVAKTKQRFCIRVDCLKDLKDNALEILQRLHSKSEPSAELAFVIDLTEEEDDGEVIDLNIDQQHYDI